MPTSRPFRGTERQVGIEQRHRSVRGSELRKQRFLARLQLAHLGLEFRPGEAVLDRVDNLPDRQAEQDVTNHVQLIGARS